MISLQLVQEHITGLQPSFGQSHVISGMCHDLSQNILHRIYPSTPEIKDFFCKEKHYSSIFFLETLVIKNTSFSFKWQVVTIFHILLIENNCCHLIGFALKPLKSPCLAPFEHQAILNISSTRKSRWRKRVDWKQRLNCNSEQFILWRRQKNKLQHSSHEWSCIIAKCNLSPWMRTNLPYQYL